MYRMHVDMNSHAPYQRQDTRTRLQVVRVCAYVIESKKWGAQREGEGQRKRDQRQNDYNLRASSSKPECTKDEPLIGQSPLALIYNAGVESGLPRITRIRLTLRLTLLNVKSRALLISISRVFVLTVAVFMVSILVLYPESWAVLCLLLCKVEIMGQSA